MRSPWMTFRVRHLMGLVAVIAVALSLLPWLERVLVVAVWDGGFPLQVTLDDRSDRTIVAVAARPVGHVEEAEELLDHPRSADQELEDVHWVAGKAFTIWVPCSGRTSMFGRELSYYHFPALMVRVEYADGTDRLLWAQIPDGRVQRSVTVAVP